MNALTSKATDLEIDNDVKNWLKFATERDVGRKARRAKTHRDGRCRCKRHHLTIINIALQ